jgi:4'-phosphopantetheinyl transferase EntD
VAAAPVAAGAAAEDLRGGGTMIGQLLPPGVEAVEMFSDVDHPVFPGEEDLVADAVPGRQREFVTARHCARAALARLGYPPGAIRPGVHRAPQWPAGVTGSITHCAGYRAAAVARTDVVDSIGIDAEPHSQLPAGIEEAITVPGEAQMLATLAVSFPGVHFDRVLFSAKEAVYKAWSPLTGRWLGFEDARLTIDPVTGAFVARLLVDGTRTDGLPPLTALRGRYQVADGLVMTVVTV